MADDLPKANKKCVLAVFCERILQKIEETGVKGGYTCFL
jgi:hypothetical protein